MSETLMQPLISSCRIVRDTLPTHRTHGIGYKFYLHPHIKTDLLALGLAHGSMLGLHMGVHGTTGNASTFILLSVCPTKTNYTRKRAKWLADHADALHAVLDTVPGKWFLTPAITSARLLKPDAEPIISIGRSRTSELYGRVGDPFSTGAWLHGRLRDRTTEMRIYSHPEHERCAVLAVKT